ncbi:nitroreductase family protein [Muribaculum intestinale]|uniref:nitroreductase family protein n=1 Tax=Muribaculum intestinale TaxID=1796646 RepID=UPI0025A9933D|nr:nitroreductase family protein [Muribaculum intestinale]
MYPQLYNLVKQRYSCRQYLDKPVGRDLIAAVLDMARLAPSACNRQPWEFLVIDTDPLRGKVIESYGRDWVKNVPVFIVALGRHDEAWKRPTDSKDHTDIDVAIAIEHICLAATSMNLGTCWICNFDAARLTADFGLPEGIEPIAIIPLGYPDPTVSSPLKNRKPFDQVVKWGAY